MTRCPICNGDPRYDHRLWCPLRHMTSIMIVLAVLWGWMFVELLTLAFE